MKFISSALAILLLASSLCQGEEFDLGERGVVSVQVPQDWSSRGKAGAGGYTLEVKAKGDVNAKCLVTFYCSLKPSLDKEALRAQLLQVVVPFVEGSVEKKADMKDFAFANGIGSYALFTDASLVGKPVPPREYRIMGSGEILLNDALLGTVSLFADDANGKEMQTMVGIINSIKHKPQEAK